MGDAAGELAQCLQLLRLAQRLFNRFALPRLMMKLLQRQSQFFGSRADPLLQRFIELMELILGALLIGDVIAIDEDAGHGAAGIDDRLKYQVNEALLWRCLGRSLELNGHVSADIRLALGVNGVEQLEEALLGNFR